LKFVVHGPIVFHLPALIIRRMNLKRRTCISALLATALPGPQAQGTGALVVDETWLDAARRRELPVRVRWPDGATHPGPRPVLLFSHGLGGTREGGAVWGEAWAAAGFVVLHLQHAGSDLAAIRGVTNSFTDQRALRSLAGPAQLLARLRDVTFALDEIGRRHAAGQDRWGMARPAQVGLSGHSFGAHTTLGMAGQRYAGFAGIDEPRLASFIAFSPSVPAAGDARQAFERMTRPLLAITGTRDSDVAGVGATPAQRMAVYPALPAGGKAHLVLQDADHMTFAGQTGRAAEIVPHEQISRDLQDAHHALVAAISTDWWRATLLGDAAARRRLEAPQGLRSGDRWQQK
jgi:predicted dienelactone hydrolase